MISLVIPTLNEERHMKPLLESLKPQLHEGDELIVVDSFSKDRTCAIARRYGCRIIRVPRRGIAAAKNAGAEKAKNGIVAFLDADSVVSGRWLKKIRHCFEHHRYSAVAGLDLYHSRNKTRQRIYDRYSRYVFQSARMLYRIGGKPWMPANNCAIDRDLFLKLKYSNVVCEDVDLMKRWPKAAKVHYDPSMIVYLSDRRFVEEGFRKTLAAWLVADVKAWRGKGISARRYSRVRI